MIMKTRIEFTHNGQQMQSSLYDIVRKSFASDIGVGFANLNHSQALFTLDDKIRKNGGTQIVQEQSCGIPAIYGTLIGALASITISLFFPSSERIIKPIRQALIGTSDGEFAVPLGSVSISSLFHVAKIKAALAIDYAGYVCQLGLGLVCGKWNILSHISSLVDDQTIINEGRFKCHRERLSEKAQKWDAIV